MNIDFRLVSASDDEFLFQLFASANGNEFRFLPPEQQASLLRMQFEAQRRSYRAQFPESEGLLILLEGGPVGLLWLFETGAEIRVVDLAIVPEYRNQGIGSAALRTVVTRADRLRKPIRLTVRTNNEPAARLYERLGFTALHADAMFVHLERLPAATLTLSLPEPSLVLLIGAAGSGKSSFAKKHFRPTEILSSDFCRGLVSDDESSQAATQDAFEVLRFIAAKRLGAGRLTVIDATNVQPEARERSLELAREFQISSVAIVFNLPQSICLQRNERRQQRCVSPAIIEEQLRAVTNSLPALTAEGFARVYVLNSVTEVESVVIERLPSLTEPRA